MHVEYNICLDSRFFIYFAYVIPIQPSNMQRWCIFWSQYNFMHYSNRINLKPGIFVFINKIVAIKVKRVTSSALPNLPFTLQCQKALITSSYTESDHKSRTHFHRVCILCKHRQNSYRAIVCESYRDCSALGRNWTIFGDKTAPQYCSNTNFLVACYTPFRVSNVSSEFRLC